jgi:hypothetical protein
VKTVGELQRGLDAEERGFLLSLVANKPDWALLKLAHLEHLPGIRWKLQILNGCRKPIPRNLPSNSMSSLVDWLNIGRPEEQSCQFGISYVMTLGGA